MNKKQTTTTLALVGMALLTTIMTTTINYVTPASALGHFKEPNGSADFSGLPMNDKTSEFDGLLDKDHRSGYDTFLDGTSGALSGFPDEEMNAASIPEQRSDDMVKIAKLKMEKLLLLITIAAEEVWIQTGKVMKNSKDVFLRLK